MPIVFQPNNDLKTEPVVFGLRVSNIMYLFLILIIGIVTVGISSSYMTDMYPLWGLLGLAIFAAYFYLRNIEKRYDAHYLDKKIVFISQPKLIKGKNYKDLIIKNGKAKTTK